MNPVLINLIIGFYLLRAKSSNLLKRWGAFQHVCNRVSRRIVVCELGRSLGSKKKKDGVGKDEFWSFDPSGERLSETASVWWRRCVRPVFSGVFWPACTALPHAASRKKNNMRKAFPASPSFPCAMLHHCCIGKESASPLLYPLSAPLPSTAPLLAARSRWQSRLSETAAHSLIDMWVLCFWNSARSMSAPRPPPTLPSPSAIFETAADSVSGISIHSAAERQHSLKKVDGSKVFQSWNWLLLGRH